MLTRYERASHVLCELYHTRTEQPSPGSPQPCRRRLVIVAYSIWQFSNTRLLHWLLTKLAPRTLQSRNLIRESVQSNQSANDSAYCSKTRNGTGPFDGHLRSGAVAPGGCSS